MRLTYLLAAFGFSIIVFAFLLPRAAYAQVIINEVMADPAATSDKSEWVELYNYSTQAVDLRGWSLDGKLIASANPINIQPQSYYIVTKTLPDFVQEFGAATDVVELGISLTNSGKTLDLIDGKGYKDSITYGAAVPSISWERRGPLCADLIKHPSSSSLNSQNAAYSTQCYLQALNITGIQFSTDNVNWTDGFSGLAPVQLYFRYSATGPAQVQSVQWTSWDDEPLTNPAQLNYYPDKPVKLTVHTDKGDFTAESSAVTIIPQLMINEFMPNPDGDDGGHEWVELYNPNDVDVSLRGMELRDAAEQMLAFADDIVLPAKGYLVSTLPSAKLQNCQKPAVCQDEIDLVDGTLTIDKAIYTDSLSGQSWSLDDSGQWQLNWAVTPGVQNHSQPAVSPTVQISELFPSPQTSKQEQEWVELYNWGTTAVDLSGWTLKDLSSSHKLTNLIISPGQYLVLTDTGISLNNGGDDISLLNSDGQAVDEFLYTAASSSYAWMRTWNDNKYSAEMKLTAQPTPGLRNVYLAQPEVVTVTEQATAAQCVNSIQLEPAQVAGVSTGEIPSTEIQKLPGAKSTVVEQPLVEIWPLFLIVVVAAVLQLLTDRTVQKWTGKAIQKVRERLSYLNHLPQALGQWKSRLPWFAAGPPA